jgi:hypothetical protein
MKNSILLFAFAMMVSVGFAQKVKSEYVPLVIKIAFEKQYPSVKNATWNKEKNQYEASFDLNKVDNSVLIDESGTILETEVEIELNQLPKGVIEYVKANYKGASVKEAAKITNAAGVVTYEVEIKRVDIIFNDNRKFIKETKD